MLIICCGRYFLLIYTLFSLSLLSVILLLNLLSHCHFLMLILDFCTQMIGTSTRLPPIQRLVEIKTIAELLHFKISTVLLHGGKLKEAITWFHQHNASYKKLVGAPEVVFLHWEWLSRQFLVFAELLDTSSVPAQSISSLVLATADRPLTESEFHPSYYYQVFFTFLACWRFFLLVLYLA